MKSVSGLCTCLLGIYFCMAIVSTGIEIPRQPVGFKYVPTPAASPSSEFLNVKVFLDILCPDSYQAFRLLLSLMPRYFDQGVRLTVVLFPLPYHQHSYSLTKAAHAIHHLNSSLTYHWIAAVYENMDIFSMSNTMKSTGEKVLFEIVKLATQVGLDSDKFLTMYSTRKIELETRTSFKYGCLRGVTFTPTYLINDVPIVMASNLPGGNITSFITSVAPNITSMAPNITSMAPNITSVVTSMAPNITSVITSMDPPKKRISRRLRNTSPPSLAFNDLTTAFIVFWTLFRI